MAAKWVVTFPGEGIYVTVLKRNIYVGGHWDAYFGLMRVGRKGGIAHLLANTATEGGRFNFTNGLDFDSENGYVYFTDSSTTFQRRYNAEAIQANNTTGRLLRYNLRNRQVEVLYSGLAFPNGVALSKNNSFILVAESNKYQILKFQLHGTTTYTPQVFSKVISFVDNIKRTNEELFWAALNYPKGTLQKELLKAVNVNEEIMGTLFYDNGTLAATLPRQGRFEYISEIEEHRGHLYIGSPKMPFLGKVKKPRSLVY